MTQQPPKADLPIRLILIGLAAWAIPGGGHFLINQRKHAIVIFITITLTFLIGLLVGSVGIIDPIGARLWYYGQMLVSPAVGMLGQITIKAHAGNQLFVHGRPQDYGQIYTCLAGLLNLLCILNAVYRAYSGIGEKIGTEEEEVHAA